MYVGIDIGGTKTLVAALSDDGKITDSRRFPTDHDYDRFLSDLGDNLAQLPLEGDFKACAGVAGLLDRKAGTVHSLGNLPWRDKAIRADISRLIGGRWVMLENDSRLAGLSEARLVMDEYEGYVLFATVSTGIGGALIRGGRPVAALKDMEMGKMPLLQADGKLAFWEDFAGGRGLVERLHKRAADITDPAEWRTVGEQIAYGLAAVCSVLQPEAIILGGSVGAHAEQYREYILAYFREHLHPVVRQPRAILPARRPDEAVIYGCYDLLKHAEQADHATEEQPHHG